MHPVLFHLGGVTVYTYGVLVATGVLIGLWVARRQARRAGLDPERIWNLGIYMVLAALVTAKLWLVVLYWSYYVEHPRELFALSTLQSGGVFYGGFLGAVAVLLLYCWRQRLPVLAVGDVFAPALALGQAGLAPVGRHVHQPAGRAARGHAARGASASNPALRSLRRISQLPDSAGTRSPAAVHRPVVRHLPGAVRTGAGNDRIFPQRSGSHPALRRQRVLDATDQRRPRGCRAVAGVARPHGTSHGRSAGSRHGRAPVG